MSKLSFRINAASGGCAVVGCDARFAGGLVMIRIAGVGDRTVEVCDAHYRVIHKGSHHEASVGVSVPTIKGGES